jgi:hypothetical protein
MRMAVMGYALLLGVADATNRTGDETVAPFAGKLTVTCAAALPMIAMANTTRLQILFTTLAS